MARRRLKTLSDVRRYLANLINRVEAGEVDADLAGKLGYLANSLVKVIEGADVVKQLEQVEKQIAEGKRIEKIIKQHKEELKCLN